MIKIWIIFIKNSAPFQKEKYRLHGWDNEKIYFWDEDAKKELCVSDEKELYDKLLEICIKYFREEKEAK